MMVSNVITSRSVKRTSAAAKRLVPKITLFHCSNVAGAALAMGDIGCDLQSVKMPCSSMTREVFLLRAFEAGADAVMVVVCPEDSCNYLEGNIRAGKRVARAKRLLDEVGLDGRRLNIFRIPREDLASVRAAITQTMADLEVLGPNPAA